MNPYNLAVCFGPTLASVPPGLDPVAAQPHANEAIKCLILEPEATFPPPTQLPGPLYEAWPAPAPPDEDCEDPGTEENEGDGPLEPLPGTGKDEPEAPLDAVGRFAYVGRSAQELSFQPGDRIRLLAKASEHWWRGELHGARGLVPHKYISLPPSGEPGQSPRTSGSDADSGSPPAESVSRLRVNSDGGRQRTGTSPSRRLVSPFLDMGPLPLPLPGAPRPLDRTERPGPAGGRPTSAERQGAVEMDKGVLRGMDCVFKELLTRSAGRPGGADEKLEGPERPRAAAAGKRSPGPPKPRATGSDTRQPGQGARGPQRPL